VVTIKGKIEVGNRNLSKLVPASTGLGQGIRGLVNKGERTLWSLQLKKRWQGELSQCKKKVLSKGAHRNFGNGRIGEKKNAPTKPRGPQTKKRGAHKEYVLEDAGGGSCVYQRRLGAQTGTVILWGIRKGP